MKLIKPLIIICVLCVLLILCCPKKIPDLYSFLYPTDNGIGIIVTKKINDDRYEVTYIENNSSKTQTYSYKKLCREIHNLHAIDVKKISKNDIKKKLTLSGQKYKMFVKKELTLLNQKNNFTHDDERLYDYYQWRLSMSIDEIIDEYITGTKNAIKLTE